VAWRLLVYGDLCRGQIGHFLLRAAPFIGIATTEPEYRIRRDNEGSVELEPFGSEPITGELYEVTAEQLRQIDAWEDADFRRRIVVLDDGSLADAYMIP